MLPEDSATFPILLGFIAGRRLIKFVPTAYPFPKAARSFFLSNLPTLVLKISSTNSNLSGMPNLDNRPLETNWLR